MTEREKLISWRVFLAGCEQEFDRALRDLSRLPVCASRESAKEIDLGTRRLALEDRTRAELIRPGVELPSIASLQQKVHRRTSDGALRSKTWA